MKRLFLAVALLAQTPPLAAQTAPINLDKIPDPATYKTLKHSSGDYTLTENDVLWMGRMIHGETRGGATKADADAMIWAIAQRRFYAKGFRSWTIEKLVQKYSQPVNTRWLRDGPECGKYTDAEIKKHPKSHACAAHRFPLREEYAKKEWKDLSKVARQALYDFVGGTSVNPVPGGVGWYAKGVWESRENNGANASEWEKPVFGWEIEHNVFYKSSAKASDTTSWNGSEVTVQ